VVSERAVEPELYGIKKSFEYKQQTLVGFLDISGQGLIGSPNFGGIIFKGPPKEGNQRFKSVVLTKKEGNCPWPSENSFKKTGGPPN
jgi:hypothetical protein